MKTFNSHIFNKTIPGIYSLDRKIEYIPEKVFTRYFGEYAIYSASTNGKLLILKSLLDNVPETLFNYSHAFAVACENGHIHVLKYLFDHFIINPGISNNYAFRCAAQNGHTRVLEYLMGLMDHRINPSDSDNASFCLAVENGHLETVKFLLQLDSTLIDLKPSSLQNYSLSAACRNEHLSVLDYLCKLKDPRVDLLAINNNALLTAVESGNLQVVKFLIGVIGNPGLDSALSCAISHGHLQIVDYITNIKEDLKHF